MQQRYASMMIIMLDRYRQLVWSELENIIPRITARFDDDADIIDQAFTRIRDKLNQAGDGQYTRMARDAASMVNRANQNYHNELIGRVLGVNPVMVEPWLNADMKVFINQNASLIKTLPFEGLADIEQMVYRDSSRKLSPPEMRAKIREQFDVTDGRARVIARDQISKFNANLSQKRQTNAGIDKYTWRTVQDGRVRDRHAHLEGKVFKWSDPPVTVTEGKRAGERNHPGEDIQCRCFPEPVIDHLL